MNERIEQDPSQEAADPQAVRFDAQAPGLYLVEGVEYPTLQAAMSRVYDVAVQRGLSGELSTVGSTDMANLARTASRVARSAQEQVGRLVAAAVKSIGGQNQPSKTLVSGPGRKAPADQVVSPSLELSELRASVEAGRVAVAAAEERSLLQALRIEVLEAQLLDWTQGCSVAESGSVPGVDPTPPASEVPDIGDAPLPPFSSPDDDEADSDV